MKSKNPEQRILEILKEEKKIAVTTLAIKSRLNYYHLWIILERLESENKIEVIRLGSYNYIQLK